MMRCMACPERDKVITGDRSPAVTLMIALLVPCGQQEDKPLSEWYFVKDKFLHT